MLKSLQSLEMNDFLFSTIGNYYSLFPQTWHWSFPKRIPNSEITVCLVSETFFSHPVKRTKDTVISEFGIRFEKLQCPVCGNELYNTFSNKSSFYSAHGIPFSSSTFFNSSHWIQFCFPIITYVIILYRQIFF